MNSNGPTFEQHPRTPISNPIVTVIPDFDHMTPHQRDDAWLENSPFDSWDALAYTFSARLEGRPLPREGEELHTDQECFVVTRVSHYVGPEAPHIAVYIGTRHAPYRTP